MNTGNETQVDNEYSPTTPVDIQWQGFFKLDHDIKLSDYHKYLSKDHGLSNVDRETIIRGMKYYRAILTATRLGLLSLANRLSSELDALFVMNRSHKGWFMEELNTVTKREKEGKKEENKDAWYKR